MAIIAQGDQTTIPSLNLQPGDYTLTFSLPVAVPTWATTLIYNGLTQMGLNVLSVQNPGNQLIIHFTVS